MSRGMKQEVGGLFLCWSYSASLNMEASRSPEISVNFYLTIRNNNPLLFTFFMNYFQVNFLSFLAVKFLKYSQTQIWSLTTVAIGSVQIKNAYCAGCKNHIFSGYVQGRFLLKRSVGFVCSIRTTISLACTALPWKDMHSASM
jgi:hypothetical protein